MFPKKEPLVELKALRWSKDAENVKNGGSSGLPTQQVFHRFYRKGKEIFRLEKDDTPYSGAPRVVYSLVKMVKDSTQVIHLDGKDKWGVSFSWADAERAIMELLDASCIQRDHETANLALVSGK
jgi:hypothetical protein